jgi:hypothetical protein
MSYCFTLKIKEGSSYLQENTCTKFLCHYNIDQNLYHTGKKELMTSPCVMNGCVYRYS